MYEYCVAWVLWFSLSMQFLAWRSCGRSDGMIMTVFALMEAF